jgi:membrane associated rhomboid family serine protease
MTDFRPGRFMVLPPVVKNLVIINAIILFVQIVLSNKFGIDIKDYFALHYWKSDHYHFWQYFTHMFMHGNFSHLLMNMFALWVFGGPLENVWGSKRFFMFYILCGLGAAFLHMGVVAYQLNLFEHAFAIYQDNATIDKYGLFIKQHNLDNYVSFEQLRQFWENNPNSASASQQSINFIHQYLTVRYNEGMVGASGAVFGVLFAFGYLFPNALLYLYFLVPVKAKWVVTVYAGVELFALIQNNPGDNVAHLAHLGGMLVAFIILKVWSKQNRRELF